MMKYLCIHSQKRFYPIADKIHTIGKKQNLGQCEPRNRYTKYNMKEKRKKITGINTRTIGDRKTQAVVHKQKNKTPTKIKPIIPITHTP